MKKNITILSILIHTLLLTLAFVLAVPLSPASGENQSSIILQAAENLTVHYSHAALPCAATDPFCLDTAAREGQLTAGNTPNLPEAIGNVIRAFLGFVGVIFFALIVYAGFRWMIARGSEEDVTKAKGTVEHAVIGLVVVLLSYSLVTFVVSKFFGPPQAISPGPGGGGGPRTCTAGTCKAACTPSTETQDTGANCGSSLVCCIPINPCVLAGYQCAMVDLSGFCPNGSSPRSETCPSPLRCCQ